MLRFVIKRTIHHEDMQYHTEMLQTIDLDLPEIEYILTRGGSGNGGFDESQLVGVEVLGTYPTS
jgi:hypothetical protein